MIGPGASAIGYHRFIAVRQTGEKRSEAESGKLKAGQIVEELRVEKRKDARSGSVLGLSAFRIMRNVPSASCRCDVIQRVNLSEPRVRSLKEVARVTSLPRIFGGLFCAALHERPRRPGDWACAPPRTRAQR